MKSIMKPDFIAIIEEVGNATLVLYHGGHWTVGSTLEILVPINKPDIYWVSHQTFFFLLIPASEMCSLAVHTTLPVRGLSIENKY